MMHYEFVSSDANPNIFLFRTQFELLYEIKFKHTPYLLENAPNCADDVYELSIVLAIPGRGKTPPDPAVSRTVFAICQTFIDQLGHPIFLFICDSRDGKQAVRFRTFTRWFTEIASPYLMKIDGKFPDQKAVVNYIALIVQVDHPYRREAVTAFTDIIAAYNMPK